MALLCLKPSKGFFLHRIKSKLPARQQGSSALAPPSLQPLLLSVRSRNGPPGSSSITPRSLLLQEFGTCCLSTRNALPSVFTCSAPSHYSGLRCPLPREAFPSPSILNSVLTPPSLPIPISYFILPHDFITT